MSKSLTISFLIIIFLSSCNSNDNNQKNYIINSNSINSIIKPGSFNGVWDTNDTTYDFDLNISQKGDSIEGSYDYISANRAEARDDGYGEDKTYSIFGKVFSDSASLFFYSDSLFSSFDSAYLILDALHSKLIWHRLSNNTSSYIHNVDSLYKKR